MGGGMDTTTTLAEPEPFLTLKQWRIRPSAVMAWRESPNGVYLLLFGRNDEFFVECSGEARKPFLEAFGGGGTVYEEGKKGEVEAPRKPRFWRFKMDSFRGQWSDDPQSEENLPKCDVLFDCPPGSSPSPQEVVRDNKFDKYTLMARDGFNQWYLVDGDRIRFEDDNNKLVKVPFKGWLHESDCMFRKWSEIVVVQP